MLLQPEAEAPTRARYRVLAFACALSLITYLDRICISRARTDIQGSLGFTDTAMGLVFSAFTLGYAIFEVPVGWMGDRWGAKSVLARIVIGWSLFTALTGCVWPFSLALGPLVLNSLVVMVLVRFLFGAGEAGAYPTLTRVVSDWFPAHERGAALGDVWMYARLGGAVAPLALGRLSVFLGWRGAFWVLGGVGLVWAVLFQAWFRSRPEEHPDCNQAERDHISPGGAPHAHGGHAWPGWSALAGSVSVLALAFSSFWVCFGWYFYPTWQPKYLEDVFGFRADGWLLEVLTGLPFLCGALGCLLGGRVSDRLVPLVGPRWGRALVGLVGFVGAGLCVLATGWAWEAWQGVALLCLAFLINDLAIPAMWASSSEMGGRYAGSLAGLMNSVGAVGAMISPVVIPYALAALPGALVAGGVSADGRVRVWDAQTGGEKFSTPGQKQKARCVSVGQGARRYAVGYEDGVLVVWEGGEKAREWEGHQGAALAVALRPYSAGLASGGADGGLVVRDADTGERKFSKDAHKGATLALAYSLDGKLIATGGADGAVKLWDAEEGELRRELEGHKGPVRGVAFAPGGRLVSGGDDGAVRVWRVGDGQMVFELKGHEGPVLAVSHSREGGLIASAGEGTVRLWDAEEGKPLRALAVPSGRVTGLAFSPESMELVSAGEGGLVVWDGETGEVVRVVEDGGPLAGLAVGLDAGRAAGRWRVVFAGLAAAWFLAAVPWLFIDTRQRIGDQDAPPPTEPPPGAAPPGPADDTMPAGTPGPVRPNS